MPEMHFTIRWPDDTVTDCYSPSLVIREHMVVGGSYPVADFVERSRMALNIASERVRAKYGYACSSALDELQQIEALAERYDKDPQAQVQVLHSRRIRSLRPASSCAATVAQLQTHAGPAGETGSSRWLARKAQPVASAVNGLRPIWVIGNAYIPEQLGRRQLGVLRCQLDQGRGCELDLHPGCCPHCQHLRVAWLQ